MVIDANDSGEGCWQVDLGKRLASVCLCASVSECLCVWKNPKWTYPAITSQENGVALYVPVYDALHMQVGQSLEHRQTHSGDLLLVHPVRTNAATSTLKSRETTGLYIYFLPVPFRRSMVSKNQTIREKRCKNKGIFIWVLIWFPMLQSALLLCSLDGGEPPR